MRMHLEFKNVFLMNHGNKIFSVMYKLFNDYNFITVISKEDIATLF